MRRNDIEIPPGWILLEKTFPELVGQEVMINDGNGRLTFHKCESVNKKNPKGSIEWGRGNWLNVPPKSWRIYIRGYQSLCAELLATQLLEIRIRKETR